VYAGKRDRKKEKREGTEGGDINAPHVHVCAPPSSPPLARAGAEYAVRYPRVKPSSKTSPVRGV